MTVKVQYREPMYSLPQTLIHGTTLHAKPWTTLPSNKIHVYSINPIVKDVNTRVKHVLHKQIVYNVAIRLLAGMNTLVAAK